MDIVLDAIPLSQTSECNTSNHWDNNIMPTDYLKKLDETYTNKWIDKFHTDYKKIIIDDPYHIRWLLRANFAGRLTRSFPKTFVEERDELVKWLNSNYGDILKKNIYFIRTENVSLKSGIWGVGPYIDYNTLIDSLVTCRKGHSPFDNYSLTSLTLYLLPWVSNIRNEFRVFVYKGEIKAISQQNIYRVLYSDKEKDYLSKLCYIVIDSFYFDIKNKIF